MLVIGISGKKQSGKTTTGNLIVSLYLAKLNYCEKIFLNENGDIIISDLFGDTRYEGVFTNKIAIEKFYDPRIIEYIKILESKVKIYNFADVLKKDICINMLGMSYDQCYGTDDDKNSITNLVWDNMPKFASDYESKTGNMTAREVMQFVGTEIFRKMDTEIWVRATINKILADKPEIAVITDCRFPNEIEAIKNIDGQIIRLTRSPFASDHLSETILDKDKYDWSNFDHVIDNQNYSLIQQCEEIKNLIGNILLN
jgi:hypothetical protein